MKYIPYGRQCIDRSDIREVVKVLKSDWITQGPRVQEFENALASYCGANYAIAVSSGTAALHLACLASGLKKDDEAITSPITFLATPNSVFYAGARPVFADINEETINIDPKQIQRKITKRTKVILPVHFGGLPCDMAKIYAIARKNNLIVVEDACHALGAKYRVNGKWFKVGSCSHSDMAVFSFHPIKHITTGEGGAITTNNKKFYEKLMVLRNHGIHRDKNTVQKWPWYYEMRDLGFNYRITDFQCALGISQLRKLNQFIKRRKEIANTYSHFFKNIDGIATPFTDKNLFSSWHLYVLKINFTRFRLSRTDLMNKLKKNYIGTQVHYIPIYRQPFYRKNLKISSQDYPNAENYYSQALSLPIYPSLDIKEVDRVIKSFKAALD